MDNVAGCQKIIICSVDTTIKKIKSIMCLNSTANLILQYIEIYDKNSSGYALMLQYCNLLELQNSILSSDSTNIIYAYYSSIYVTNSILKATSSEQTAFFSSGANAKISIDNLTSIDSNSNTIHKVFHVRDGASILYTTLTFVDNVGLINLGNSLKYNNA